MVRTGENGAMPDADAQATESALREIRLTGMPGPDRARGLAEALVRVAGERPAPGSDRPDAEDAAAFPSAPPDSRQRAVRMAHALRRIALTCDPFSLAEAGPTTVAEGSTPSFAAWLEMLRNIPDRPPADLPVPDPATADADELLGYLRTQPAASHRLPFLLQLWQRGEADTFLTGCGTFRGHPAARAYAPLLAWGAWRCGEADGAREWLATGPDNFLSHNLRAAMALAAGDADAAREHWARSLAFEPLQPHIVRQLATPAAPEIRVADADLAETSICLYSWNKVEPLMDTLRSLAASDIGPARVVLLNNGSTVYTSDELERAVASAAPGLRVRFDHLPVNIGAPAARNWLLTRPDVLASRFVAFLDDDVILPPHWLRCYHQTLAAHPGAVAAGPKTVGPARPRPVQYVYRFMDRLENGRFFLTPNAPALTDLGQFDAPLPALTVMGCCHLFHMERWNALGVPDFDIRFSPSQVDDIEHDLQIWKAGGEVVYDGRVEVLHLQDTGAKIRGDLRAFAMGLANHRKMEAKFEPTELAAMQRNALIAEQRDWNGALSTVGPVLPAEALAFYA